MDKSTLSNYGWIVIVTLVLAVMLALATPFGTFVGKGASNVIKTFVQSSDNAVDEDNIDTQSENWDNYLNNGVVDELVTMDPIESVPGATEIAPAMKEYATAPVTENYLYAKQQMATTIEEAFVQKEGITYEGTKKGVYWGTGDLIKVYKDGELLGDYYVVVLGDTIPNKSTGVSDGVVDVIDAAATALTFAGFNDVTGAFMMATDVNGDGQISEEGDKQIIYDIMMEEEGAYEDAFINCAIDEVNISYDVGVGGLTYALNGSNAYITSKDGAILNSSDNSRYIDKVSINENFEVPSHTKFNMAWIDGSFSHWVNQKTGETISGTVSVRDLVLANGLDNNIVLEAQWNQEWF